jgi:uroporphyrinogen-III synthase
MPIELTQQALAGLSVLVTRPAHQAADLCRLIEGAGGKAVQLPALEIVDVEDKNRAASALQRAAQARIVIFASANAVDRALALCQAQGLDLAKLSVLAVGPATAAALRQGGVAEVLIPQDQYSSEGLLDLPELSAPRVTDQRIVIFKGVDGRQVLQEVLRDRGAEVTSVELYRCLPPRPGAGDAAFRDWLSGELFPVGLVTSGAALTNLFAMMNDEDRLRLLDSQLVVIGERLLTLARQFGFSHDPVVAQSASDAGLCKALARWWAASKPSPDAG